MTPTVPPPTVLTLPSWPLQVASLDPVRLAYVGVFGLAAVVCFASLLRLDRIEDADTRRGLAGLLVTSGAWALTLVGVIVSPAPSLAYAFHVAGLVVGLATVGPWLYFCSAYTGRSLHRDPWVRTVAVAVFVGLVLVKVTNPLHGLYFTALQVDVPFSHLAIQPDTLHWLVMGLAYALAAVGYFMLYELFVTTDMDTRPFAVLVAITGLPVLLDVLALETDALLAVNYEPLGVAVFAVGVVTLYMERLRTVRLAGERAEPAIVLDDDGRVRDSNADARVLFPALTGAIGVPLAEAEPSLADKLDTEGALVERETEHGTRYYRVSSNPFGADDARLGRLIVLDDVTHREQYRRELERQNERLDSFASMVSHDLRNPLNVASLRLEAAASGDDPEENIDGAQAALERMEGLIEDVLALARQGQPIDDPEPVSLAAAARRGWTMVSGTDAELAVADDLELLADPDRLQQLLENLFRNAVEHGGADVTVTVGPLPAGDGFYVSDDGVGIPAEERDSVFESGYTTSQGGTGFGLAIVAEIVDAHRWAIDVTEAEGGGARFEITDVDRP